MPPFHDNEALLYFEVADLAPETFLVEAFTGEEALSRPFRFEINLRSEDPDLKLDEIVGKPAVFEMLGRKVFGVVAEFTAAGHAAHTHSYRAVLVPRLWLLGLRVDTRIFFDQMPNDLIKHVLEEAGFSSQDFRPELSATYTEHEFYTQYAESDLDFASRIAEHHGIAFRFEHKDNRDVTVFFDDSKQAKPIDGDPDLFFNPEVSLASEEPVASSLVERAQIVPGIVRVKDYNYRTPETALLSEAQVASEPVGYVYEYGAHQKDTTEGDHIARVRNEEIESSRRVLRIESNRADLIPGRSFKLKGHFLNRLNVDYLIVEVHSRGDHRFFTGAGGSGDPVYQNDVTCIPLATPFRPARLTPVPRVPGLHTARIETAGGEYAHLDEEGRYHVKFDYDLSDRTDATASRPVRMNQPYSGPNYGIHFPNHADTEVILGFVNGDPDRPLALGTAPNPSNKSP
ncbi:MAG TPA: type VI secretion system tip protein TssI/VgrG, partial [Rhodothermales bacterium]|nr:type VI secretion system tip protein TssI/VgrG [Rhodothermales bacterium]